MPKSKHINKKKVAKKIVKHNKNVKHNNNNKNDKDKHTPLQMSRLEYEQSMMDPRFRAAMQGFNNTPNNAQQYLNHSLHEQELKNNELTRQIVFQNDLANAKQANMQLKNELSTTKMQHQQEISAKQLELANERTKHEIETIQNKHKYDEQISQLNSAIANEKQQYADAQQRWKQKEDKRKAKHDLQIQQLQSQHDKEINDIKAITNDLARKTDIENMEFRAAQDVAQAAVDKTKAEIQHHFQPITQRLEAMNNELKRKDDILRTQYDELKSYKDAQANLIKEGIKSQLKPLTQQLNAQAQTLSNINTTQQLLHDEQSKLQSAKMELSKAQIKAINEPLIHQLEQQKQQLEGIIKMNGDINGLYQRIEDLKTNIEILKQRATPEQIAAHGSEVRDVALAAAPLEISKRLAERTHQANLEYEQQYSKLIELGAQALGEAFDVNKIGTTALNDQLREKTEWIQKERAKLAAQTETIQRQLKMQEGLEVDKIENAKARAKLDVIMEHDSQYNQSIYKAGKERAKIEEENNKLHTIATQLQRLKTNNEDLYIDTIHDYNQLLDQDQTGTLRRLAKEINHGKDPDPRQLPELLKDVKTMYDRTIETLQVLPPGATIHVDPNDTSSRANEQRAFMDLVFKMDNAFRERGYHTADIRNQMQRDLESARNQIERDVTEKMNMQDRIKQLEMQKQISDNVALEGKRYLQSMYYNTTRPYKEVDGKGVWGGLGERNDETTKERAIPYHDQHALPMTFDNMRYITADTGKTVEDLYNYINGPDIDKPTSINSLPDFLSEEYHPEWVNWREAPQSAYPTPTSSATSSPSKQ